MARILIVDDDEGVRSFLAEALETGSHQVTEAASGEEALRCLRLSRFHLLITDLRMPGQGGLDLLRHARAGWPEMETMVLTAFSSSQAASEALKLGASDLLHKPLPSPEALRRRVGQALSAAR
jgi:two-component system response regulator FlrC